VKPAADCDGALLISVDASGILNPEALNRAGQAIRQSIPSIVRSQCVTSLTVEWFGPNGFSPVERARVALPAPRRVAVQHPGSGDLDKVRRDVAEERKHQEDETAARIQATVSTEDERALAAALAPVSDDVLIPPPEVSSHCTDLTGALRRAVTPATRSVNQIAIVITDGRQNCEGIETVAPPPARTERVTLIVVLVPGTYSAGWEDYELRKARVAEAYPWATVIPYYHRDLDQLVASAARQTRERDSLVQK
jgi:hypothetical protein